MKILYLSEHNSCRAPLAAAITNQIGDGKVEATSAGIDPKPIKQELLDELRHLDLASQRSISIPFCSSQSKHYDLIIALCSRSANSVETLSHRTELIRWDEHALDDAHDIHHLARELSERIRLMLLAKHLI